MDTTLRVPRLLAIAVIFLVGSTYAANPASAPSVPPWSPFKLTDAATEAESASLTWKAIESDLSGDQSLAMITEDLPVLTSEIAYRGDETTRLLSSNPSLQLLGTQEQDWTGISRNLDVWKHTIERREAQLDQYGNTLKTLHDRWAAEQPVVDYYNGIGKSDTATMRQTGTQIVQGTLSTIDRANQLLRRSRIDTARTHQDVNTQIARVLDMLDSIGRARDDAFNRLFTRTDVPLWSAPLTSGNSGGGVFTQGRDSFTRQLQAMIAYIQRRPANAGLQLFIFTALAIGLFRIRKVVGEWASQDPQLKPITLAFASPLATALVLSLLLSIWIYPQAPRMFWAMVGAAALIPTVVILRRLIDPRLFSILNSLVVFYFLDQLRSIVAVVPVMARFLLLLEMLGGAVLLLLFIRSVRLGEQSAGRLWKIILFVGWVWAAAFIVAFLGDIAGYSSLANMIGDAALGSAYLAVILFAATRVLASFIVIALRSRPLSLLQMARRHQALLVQRLRTVLYWLASFAWVLGVMASLSIASIVWDFLKRTLSFQLGYGDLRFSPGHLLIFAVTIWLAMRVSRFIRFVLEEDVYNRFALPSGIPYAISQIINYVVLLVGFFVAVSALGYDMTKLTILAGAFSLGIGFGLQNIFNNFVSGLILLFERPVRVGDVVQLDDTVGVVGHIGIRASIIRTADSSEIIVPNGNLISNKVVNWTLSNRQRGLTIPITLASTADPCKVINLLQGVAAAQQLVTRTPAPQALLTHLGADSFSYELHVWTNSAEQWGHLRSELAMAINTALVKENIAIK